MVPGNRVSFLHDGEQCLPAMLEAIAQARVEILLEMYWFGSDATGRRFAAALADKARQGLRVCVSYDAVGSFETDRAMFEDLRAVGCDVQEHNPLELFSRRFSFRRFNRRNHRKMLLVDGRIAFTGGLNLGDAWAPAAEGGGGFRDDMVRVEGPAATTLRGIFVHAYRGARARELHTQPPEPPEACGTSRVRVLANDRWRDRRVIERTYLEQIQAAKKRVLITNSYFIPRRQVRRALAAAVSRGVHVAVLVPGQSDVPAVMYATRRLYGRLLSSGVEIYEWTASILHAKTAVVDDAWCTVGTYNLDYRSWAYNLEISLAIEDGRAAQALAKHMLSDMERSARPTLHNWSFRSLGERVLEEIFYRLRRFL
jgi:cardiolipin synthase